MKKILFSLMILAIYASANTCTKAVFKLSAFDFIVNKNEPHLDSSYFKEYDNEWTHKYFYKNGQIDSLAVDFREEGEEIKGFKFYRNVSPNDIRKTDREYIIKDSTFGDTIYYTQDFYMNGVNQQRVYLKRNANYISSLEYNVEDNKYSYLNEMFFSHDTLIDKTSDYYNKDSEIFDDIYYIEDTQNDFKCYEYEGNELNYTYTYQPNESGYSLKVVSDTYFREFFFVNPDGTTAIHKRRVPVKISPKARYFDLLGRYKFTK